MADIDDDGIWRPLSALVNGGAAGHGEALPCLPKKSRLSTLKHRLFDLVYPPSCIGCSAALSEAEGLCPACWRATPFIERPFCERLGTPLPVDHGGALISPAASSDPPVFGRARAVTRYDGLARELVHRLKYNDRIDLAAPMARWMARAGHDILNEATLIIPVPLHYRRLWWRRFNQAAALGIGVAQAAGVPIASDTLIRVKPTRPQVGLTRAERATNLQGAFRVREQNQLSISDARIVLIDDVMTTASTGNAAARVLLRAGAASVDLLVFACVANTG